jgi:hypothetical protein
VRDGLNYYLELFRTNPVLKGLTKYNEHFIFDRLQSYCVIKDFYLENMSTKLINM